MTYAFPRFRKPCNNPPQGAPRGAGVSMAFKTKRASVLALVRPFALCLASLYPLAAIAAEPEVPSPSNYGGAGLLDMRTARFFPDGYISFSTSFTQPDDRYALTFQALPWAEFTFRY